MKYTYLLKITLAIQPCIDRILYIVVKYTFYNLKIR